MKQYCFSGSKALSFRESKGLDFGINHIFHEKQNFSALGPSWQKNDSTYLLQGLLQDVRIERYLAAAVNPPAEKSCLISSVELFTWSRLVFACSQLKISPGLQRQLQKDSPKACKVWKLSSSFWLNTISPYTWCFSKNIHLPHWGKVKNSELGKLPLPAFVVTALNAVFICISLSIPFYGKSTLWL